LFLLPFFEGFVVGLLLLRSHNAVCAPLARCVFTMAFVYSSVCDAGAIKVPKNLMQVGPYQVGIDPVGPHQGGLKKAGPFEVGPIQVGSG
jgi:hypothetical protein